MRAGFTFIEVICILLVVSLGLMAAIGLMDDGLLLAARSRGAQLGLPTAVSVALDPTPLLPARTAHRWSYTPSAMDGPGPLSSTAQGVINGFFVVRHETSTDADIISQDQGRVYLRSALVAVDVYDATGAGLVASYSTRIIHQRGLPSP
jgi:hypothetical protein